MLHSEVGRVLVKCAAYDRRTIGEGDVLAWHEILEDVELADALEGVRRHYRASSDWAMPADILRHAAEAKRDRRRHERSEKSAPLALPSRYELGAGDQAKPAFDRSAEVRAEARRRIAEAQAKFAKANNTYADEIGGAMAALDKALDELQPPEAPDA